MAANDNLIKSERVKAVAVSMVRLSVGCESREFLAACAIAAGMFIRSTWEPRAVDDVLAAHIDNVTMVAKEPF
jgi:hypothetical protein